MANFWIAAFVAGFSTIVIAEEPKNAPRSCNVLGASLIITGSKCKQHDAGFFLVYGSDSQQKCIDDYCLKTENKADSGTFDIRSIKVDYSKYVIVVIYYGDVSNCTALNIDQVTEEEARIVVKYKPAWFQSDIPNSICSNPYALLVMPKTSKKIVIEEDTQITKGQPSKWKVRAILNDPGPK